MADEIVLKARPRAERGRSAARRLRAAGYLPGIIYGSGIEPVALAVPRAELLRVLHAHGTHPLVTVAVDGGQRYLALVKDLQIDHVHQTALHVDFHRVQADKPVQSEVEVVLEGTAAGVRLGGVLEQIVRTVPIEALPRDLPEHVVVDVRALEIGQTLRLGDIVPPPGVTILGDPEQTLATVVAPRVAEEVGLTPEEAEALAGLSPEELEALRAFAASAPPEAAAPSEGAGEE